MGKKHKIRGKELSQEIDRILVNRETGDPKLVAAAQMIQEGDYKTAQVVLKKVKGREGKELLNLLKKEKSLGQSGISCLAYISAAVILGIILIQGSDEDAAQDATKEGPQTDDATSTPMIITTIRGTLQVPGDAFMDGRDQEAQPPLTIMNINIWNNASRSRVVCTLAHGAAVEVREAKWADDEDRYYLKIKGDNCEGWVSDPFVSPQWHEPVGDQF